MVGPTTDSEVIAGRFSALAPGSTAARNRLATLRRGDRLFRRSADSGLLPLGSEHRALSSSCRRSSAPIRSNSASQTRPPSDPGHRLAEKVARSQLIGELLGRGTVEFRQQDLGTPTSRSMAASTRTSAQGCSTTSRRPGGSCGKSPASATISFSTRIYWYGKEAEVRWRWRDTAAGGTTKGDYTAPVRALSGLRRRSFWLTLPSLLK